MISTTACLSLTLKGCCKHACVAHWNLILLVRSCSSDDDAHKGRKNVFMFSSDGNDDGVDEYDEDDDVACDIAISVALACFAFQTL